MTGQAFNAGPVPSLGLVPRVHTYSTWSNPYMVCTVCRVPVTRWHNPEQCECPTGLWNVPCGHHAGAVTACPSWRDDGYGCTCVTPVVAHSEYLAGQRKLPLWAQWPIAQEAAG